MSNIAIINNGIDDNILVAAQSLFAGKPVNISKPLIILETRETVVGTNASDDQRALIIQKVDDATVIRNLYTLRENILSLYITGGILEIGSEAFVSCDIEKIKLSSPLETIGEAAFANNTYLRELTLPETLREIGEYAFNSIGVEATETAEIYIPQGVSSIGAVAFENANVIVHLMGTPSTVGPNAFNNIPHLYCDPSLEAIGAPWGALAWN